MRIRRTKKEIDETKINLRNFIDKYGGDSSSNNLQTLQREANKVGF